MEAGGILSQEECVLQGNWTGGPINLNITYTYIAPYLPAPVKGHSPTFYFFGENPISKNLEIGPTIFDKRLLVKSPFERVSDRNVRNGKMPVIGLSSPLPELQLVYAPPHSLAVSKRNAGKCMFPRES